MLMTNSTAFTTDSVITQLQQALNEVGAFISFTVTALTVTQCLSISG